MWCFTFSESPPSVISPAGTNIRDSSFKPGTGEPQILQNDICQSASGFFHEVTYSYYNRDAIATCCASTDRAMANKHV
jgi:hypothetical protein